MKSTRPKPTPPPLFTQSEKDDLALLITQYHREHVRVHGDSQIMWSIQGRRIYLSIGSATPHWYSRACIEKELAELEAMPDKPESLPLTDEWLKQVIRTGQQLTTREASALCKMVLKVRAATRVAEREVA